MSVSNDIDEQNEEKSARTVEEVHSNGESSGAFSGITDSTNFPLIFEVQHPEKRRNWIRPVGSWCRIVSKNGKLNIFISKIPNKQLRYLKDLGNTLINIRWRWILLSLCLANAVAYVFFALMWMAVGKLNGDEHRDKDIDKCIVGTSTFLGYLILSIETITTIGTGEIYPTDCHEGWVIMTLQAIVGVAIEGALVTAVYVKLSRPLTRDQMEIFSKKAVICMRDEKLCLICRIRDNIGKFWAKTKISAFFCVRKVCIEGEELSNYFLPLKLQPYGLLIWPMDIVHVIDEKSPLWDISAKDLLTSRFEIMVVIKGDSILTGQPSQTQTSYLSSEILWGYRFACCTTFDEDKERYIVDCKKFNVTITNDIPLCSASRFNEVLKEISSTTDMKTLLQQSENQ